MAKRTVKEEEQLNKLYEKREKLLDRINARGSEHHTQTKSRIKLTEKINALEYKGSQVQKDVGKRLVVIEKNNRKLVAQGKDKFNLESRTLKLNKQAMKNLDKGLKTGQIGRDVGQEILDINEDILSGHMTLEGLKSKELDIQARLNDGFIVEDGIKRSLTQQEKDAYKEQLGVIKTEGERINANKVMEASLKAQEGLLSGIGSAIGINILSPMAAAAAILALFNAQQEAIASEFGVIGVTEMRDDLADVSQEFTKIGLDSKEAMSTIKSLGTEFGISSDKAIALADSVGDIAVLSGMSTDESAKLVGIFTELGGLSEQGAVELAKQTESLAAANGVAPGVVLKDIATNAETFAKFSGAGADGLARGAIQARKLGIELSDVAASMEGMLNFQDSLNAEVQASVMLGRQVNLQKARELSLAGDIEGFQQEIMKQIGSQAEFDKMNVLQKKALADATGMSVDKLAKMVSKEKEAVTLAGALESQSIEDMVPEETITAVAELMGGLQAMGMAIAESLGPTVSMLVGAFSGLLSFVDRFIGIGPALIALLIAIKGQAIAAAVGQMVSAIAGFFNAAAAGSLSTVGFGTGAMVAMAVAAGVALFGMIGKAMSFLETGTELGGIKADNSIAALHKGETVLNKNDTEMLKQSLGAVRGGQSQVQRNSSNK